MVQGNAEEMEGKTDRQKGARGSGRHFLDDKTVWMNLNNRFKKKNSSTVNPGDSSKKAYPI